MLFNRNFADLITFTRASARWRFSSGGVLVQDTANVPSLDYDPITLPARGLLVATWSRRPLRCPGGM